MVVSRLAVLTCVGALLLGGCGADADDGAKRPAFDRTAPALSEETPDPAPSDDGPIPDEPVDGELSRGSSAATGPEEQAAAEAWFGYWTEVLRMYRDGEADRDRLYALADGRAATGPLDYLRRMVSRGETQSGGVIAAVSRIRIDGDRAVLQGCFRDGTVTLARNGNPAETGLSYFTTEDVLLREGPDWRVVESTSTSENRKCEYR